MKKKFGLSSLKDKAKELANNEKVKQSISAVQDMTDDIKQSEAFFKAAEKADKIKDSDLYNQAKDSVQKQAEKVKGSNAFQETMQKSSQISKQVRETSKETFSNAKEKLDTMTAAMMSLSTIVGQERKIKQEEKFEFLYNCRKMLRNFDPFDVIVNQSEEIARQFDGYYGESLPYGRTLDFNKIENYQLDAVAFFPVPSKSVHEMKEYGIIINTNCIIIKFEVNNTINLLGRDITHSQTPNIEECIYFDRIDDIKREERSLRIEYFNMDEEFKVLNIHDKYKAAYFNDCLEKLLLFASKFDYGLDRSLQKKAIFPDYELPSLDLERKIDYLQGGVNQSITGKLNKNINDIDYSYQEAKNYPQGAGYYAEYLNAEILNTAFTKVEMVAKSNPSQKHATGDNAADFKIKNRFTGNEQMVQLKYKSSPKQLAKDIMEYDNSVMIPPDKYVETMKILKNDPDFKGKVSEQKLRSVMKGKVPYDLTIGLNRSLPKKLGMDVALSAKQSLTPALVTTGCSALIAVWKGAEPKEAIQASIKQGGKTMAISTTIGSTAKVAGRISATRLAKKSAEGAKIKGLAEISQKTARNVGKIATVSTLAITVVPDLTNAINGKVSKQQLAKTLITTGVGLVGGAAGAGVGSIPMAIAATELTSQLYDKYVKDDVLVNYQIFKEVFIDLVNRYQLPLDDVNLIIEETFANPSFNERLLELQIQCQGYNKAKYALVYSQLEGLINEILLRRPSINEDDLETLNESIIESFDGIQHQ
ncbi:hypothetical protein P7D85_14250 [Enterococcus hulanensis]|uniref:Uncharacterized protein n=1 Tax=Enterococcus hulanensis TaxID=2559929 RepID=A0ABU3F1E6_9ENTE|nr:hypothetical protein [Enterococcus hulanensis]MDT2600944.1 hypothetical protein [Enterococcus hulanensis]MDT2611532.1 hypothetical protein [Enterococcus hulanensis]MDT2617983.1 hypothetical protein [Enterococcus hulanensis]MDT2628986.1 hypothetical protein [Enterococcus hulanensis]MDT2656548.1 hypothetical protein [Enterococcus hulanensis]